MGWKKVGNGVDGQNTQSRVKIQEAQAGATSKQKTRRKKIGEFMFKDWHLYIFK